MALAASRAPDIIERTAIPLSATTDQPLAPVATPPESASNDPADIAAGKPKEITAEELAAATAARKGAGPDADPKSDGTAKPETEAKPDDQPETPPKLEFDAIPDDLPSYAVRSIQKERKKAQDAADAAWKAARAQVGDEAWQKAVDVARDTAVNEANRKAAIAAKEAKEAREALEAAQKTLDDLKAAAPKEEPKPDPRPTRDEFDNPDLYDEAMVAWGKREAHREQEAVAAEAARVDAEKKAAEEAEAKAKADEEARVAHEAAVKQTYDTWTARVEKATEKYPDFDEVTKKAPADGGPTITDAMAAAILLIENGPDIAYQLAQDPEESVRIASMPNVAEQFIELGRISERIANPPRRARPAPIEPIDTTENRADTTDAEPDMATYAERRMKALRQERAPFFPPSQIH
jgi:hypothetical protein